MHAFETLTGAEFFLVVEREEPLLEQFRQVSHVIVNRHGALYTPGAPSLEGLLETLATPGPELAVCNSADFVAADARASPC